MYILHASHSMDLFVQFTANAMMPYVVVHKGSHRLFTPVTHVIWPNTILQPPGLSVANYSLSWLAPHLGAKQPSNVSEALPLLIHLINSVCFSSRRSSTNHGLIYTGYISLVCSPNLGKMHHFVYQILSLHNIFIFIFLNLFFIPMLGCIFH